MIASGSTAASSRSLDISALRRDKRWSAPCGRVRARAGRGAERDCRLLFAVVDGGAPDGPARDHAKRLPRYPLVPATLLGRLALDEAYRRRGLGERLLIDALQRSLATSQSVASVAVIVDAKDGAGATFYARYGYVAFPDQPMRCSCR